MKLKNTVIDIDKKLMYIHFKNLINIMKFINKFIFGFVRFLSTLMAGTQDWVKGVYGILAGILGVTFLVFIFHFKLLSLLTWEVGFVDPSSAFAESLIRLYNYVWFYLILVLFIVVMLLTRVVYLFTWKASFYKLEFFFIFMTPLLRYFISLRHNLLARSKLFRSLIILNEIKSKKIKLNIWYTNDKRYIDWSWRKPMKELEKFLKISDASEYKRLEVVWCGLPTIILLSLASPSLAFIYTLDPSIDPIYTIKVIGRQWYWNYSFDGYVTVKRGSELFKYTELSKQVVEFLKDWDDLSQIYNSNTLWKEFFWNMHSLKPMVKITHNFDSVMKLETDLAQGTHRLLEVDNRLILPIGAPIRFVVTSLDVIHSWAVPSLSIKVDAVPGRLNQFIVEINKPGIYFGQCSELCGPLHGFMPIVLVAVPASEFEQWLLEVGQIVED